MLNRLLVALLVASPVAWAGQSPPKVTLYMSFDGAAEADFSANGLKKFAYVRVAYRPGVKAQGAEFGSEEFPCGLVIPAEGIFEKRDASIEFWFMPLWNPADPLQQKKTRILLNDDTPAGRAGQFWIGARGGRLFAALRGRNLQVISGPIGSWKPQTWHHVVVTLDNRRGMELYLDGERAASRAMRWVLPPSGRLYLGANQLGSQRAEGLFDELRIYDRALTPTEVELAFIHNLKFERASVVEIEGPALPRVPEKPTLTLHLTFDNIIEAQTARGNARPLVAEGAAFAPGILGQALVASAKLRLCYSAPKNLSKKAGAIAMWVKPLEGEKTWRGILLADEVKDPTSRDLMPGSLGLWLERDRLTTLQFTLWPVQFRGLLPRWDQGRWHHLAVCWSLGREASVYVNGRQVARAQKTRARWAPEGGKRFFVGSWNGMLPANALIDDLRVYDAPLSEQQVQEQAFRFILPLVMRVARTLYERGSKADLPVRFYNTTDREQRLNFQIVVKDPDEKEVARKRLSLAVPPGKHVEERIPLDAAEVAKAGLYRVEVAARGRTNLPRGYFLVVEPQEARVGTGGPAKPLLKFADTQTIEAASALSPEVFCESGGSELVRSPIGAYREAGAYPGARLAYRFTVARPGAPHVAIVTYPADKARSAEIIMTSRRFPNSFDVATGYLLDAEEVNKPKMADLAICFWPRERENALVFRTLAGGKPAACARITIHRLADQLPETGVESPRERGRSFGSYWHDPAVPMEFGATSYNPDDVYESFRRLIDYMEFVGQDTLCYPLAWRQGTLYSSEREEFRRGLGAERHPPGWLEYVLYLCEKRGIAFIPLIFFEESNALSSKYGGADERSVAAGATTARMVNWDGTLSRGNPGEPPRYNPVHPDVRQDLLARVTEVARLCGNSPAFKGVALQLGPSSSAWFASIQCGYGDGAIAEFTRDTGIKVPVGRSGPGRFAERARWLLSKRRRDWVNWRCRRLRQLYGELASRLQSTKADLKLFLDIAFPQATSPHPLLNLTAWGTRAQSLTELLREAGLDLSLFLDRPTNLVVRKVIRPLDAAYLRYRYGEMGLGLSAPLADDLAYLSEGGQPLFGFPRLGAVCAYQHFESSIGILRPMRGFWWRPHAVRGSHPLPATNRFLKPLTHAVAELDVTSLVLGGSSLATMGQEERARRFARAFRSLPAKRFADIPGLTDPVCGRELHDPTGHFFYLVNRMGVPVEAFLGFTRGDVVVRDLVEGRDIRLPRADDVELPAPRPEGFVSEHTLPEAEGPLPQKGKKVRIQGTLLRVRLEPYEMRSYRSLTKGTRIHYAATLTPAPYRLRLLQRVENAKSLVDHSTAEPDAIERARATIELIRRAWEKGEFARVEALLESYPLARLK